MRNLWRTKVKSYLIDLKDQRDERVRGSWLRNKIMPRTSAWKTRDKNGYETSLCPFMRNRERYLTVN